MNWNDPDREDTRIYKVLVNHEEQYSLWPSERENPLGWRDAGKTGSKDECLAYVKEVWTDMRPLSLRKQMEEAARRPPSEPPSDSSNPETTPPVVTLVERLSSGDHHVEVHTQPGGNIQSFKESLDSGYVQIKFTETMGGTLLRFRVDRDALDLSQADFDRQSGKVHVEGDLMLDYTNVRCIADIDLEKLRGRGHLRQVQA